MSTIADDNTIPPPHSQPIIRKKHTQALAPAPPNTTSTTGSHNCASL